MIKLYSHKKTKKIREQIKLSKKSKKDTEGLLTIKMPETWSVELEKDSMYINEPLQDFSIIEYIKKGKEDYYILQSQEKVNGKPAKIALTEHCLRYILGKEVSEQSNEGYHFEKFLPKEDAEIIITKLKNPSDIVPGQFKLELTREMLNKEDILAFSFRIFFLNGNGFCSSTDYTKGGHKSTWKCLYGDDYYMSDFEKLYCDTIIHKEFVKKSIDKLATYLEKQGATNAAKRLRYRGETHDNSKIGYTGKLPEQERQRKKEDYDDELHALSRIIGSRDLMKDTNRELEPIEREAIRLHWKNNSHHPEHFNSVLDMSTTDIMEMCCDWHSRSVQWGTDLMEYANNSQKNRFHFPDWMFQEVLYYLNILLE